MTERADAPIGYVSNPVDQLVSEPPRDPDEYQRILEMLPEKFLNAADPVGALLESYRHAENKIREQGHEINQLRGAAADDEEDSLAVEEPQPQPVETPPAQRLDPAQVMAALAAQQAAAQYRPPAAQPPQQPMPANLVVPAGMALATEADPGIEANREALGQFFQNSPNWSNELQRAASTGVAATVAKVISEAYATLASSQAVNRQQTIRQEKLAAQTLTGAQGGRPDRVSEDQERWAKIKAAGTGDYSGYMRSVERAR